MAKSKKNIRIVVKENHPEFADEVAAANTEQLNERLAELAKGREQINDTKDADEEYKEAKETAATLGAPYKDGIKVVSLKSRYIIAILKDRGVQ